jgi:hypothetical protein
MVFLNFSDSQRTLSVPFPIAGVYREMLDDDIRGPNPSEITVGHAGDVQTVAIPPNYGQVFLTPAASVP